MQCAQALLDAAFRIPVIADDPDALRAALCGGLHARFDIAHAARRTSPHTLHAARWRARRCRGYQIRSSGTWKRL
ncbi:hypothetical protein QSH18_02920 [Xanthomonas sp. NCPPB 2654]|nr:hypothetical protein [Xanthomonas sp. NCPPB 2654]